MQSDSKSLLLLPAGLRPPVRRAFPVLTRRRVAALVAVLGLLGAGCGRSGSTQAIGDTAVTSASATSAPGPGAGEFGDLGTVCGPAPDSTALTASDTGVTATSIQIGTVADPGFAGRPGVNQEFFDSAEAFSNWCNAAGGINGRKIEVKERDAKLTEFQSRMIEACDEGDFMLVGGGGIFDDQGQKERLACDLPAIAGMAVTPPSVASDLTIVPITNDMSSLPIGDLNWLAEQFPEATQKIGFLTGGIAVTITNANRNQEAMKARGWKIVYDEQFNAAGETSWRGFVEGMKSAGVRGVIWTADPSALAAVLKAMDEIEYHPDFVRAASNIYDNLLLSEAGPAANGTYIMTSTYPFLDPELAKKNPATKQYLDIMSEYDPGGKVANLGVTGFSAWLLFAKAARECGADLTRDCVWEHAKAINDWTGGGLHARQDLATGRASECFVEIEAKDGRWALTDISPNEGVFNCDPRNVFDSTVDYGQGVKCENPAFADDPKPSICAP